MSIKAESLRLTAENSALNSALPIFKKGKKEDPDNYRPVSLTSVPGKIMEKVILGVNEKHLRDNTVTGHNQHRFTSAKVLLNQFNFL